MQTAAAFLAQLFKILLQLAQLPVFFLSLVELFHDPLFFPLTEPAAFPVDHVAIYKILDCNALLLDPFFFLKEQPVRKLAIENSGFYLAPASINHLRQRNLGLPVQQGDTAHFAKIQPDRIVGNISGIGLLFSPKQPLSRLQLFLFKEISKRLCGSGFSR